MNASQSLFHTDEVPELPPCVERKAGLHSRRTLGYSLRDKAKTSSPARAELPRTNVLSSGEGPSGRAAAAITARGIGEHLMARASHKPDRMLTESPGNNTTDSPERGEIMVTVEGAHKKNPLAVWKRGDYGIGPNAMAEASRGRTSSCRVGLRSSNANKRKRQMRDVGVRVKLNDAIFEETLVAETEQQGGC